MSGALAGARAELLRACFGRSNFASGDIVIEVSSGDHVLSHADIYYRSITVAGRAERVGIVAIGQVCTAELWRGRGLASALVLAAHRIAAGAGARWTALWSDYLGFYGPLGYYAPVAGEPAFLVCDLAGERFPAGAVEFGERW